MSNRPVIWPIPAAAAICTFGCLFAASTRVHSQDKPMHAHGRSIVIDNLTIEDFDSSRASQHSRGFRIVGQHTRLTAIDPESKARLIVESPDITGQPEGKLSAGSIVFLGPVNFQSEQKDPETGAIRKASGRAGRAEYHRSSNILTLTGNVTIVASDSEKLPLPANIQASSARVELDYKPSRITLQSDGTHKIVLSRSKGRGSVSAEGAKSTHIQIEHYRSGEFQAGSLLDIRSNGRVPITVTAEDVPDGPQVALKSERISGSFSPDGSGLRQIKSEGAITTELSLRNPDGNLEPTASTSSLSASVDLEAKVLHIAGNAALNVQQAVNARATEKQKYHVRTGDANIDFHTGRAELSATGTADANVFQIESLPGNKGSVSVSGYSNLAYNAGGAGAIRFTGPGSTLNYHGSQGETCISSSNEILCYFDNRTHELRQLQQNGNVHTRYSTFSNNKYRIPRVVTAECATLLADLMPAINKRTSMDLHFTTVTATFDAPDMLHKPASMIGSSLDVQLSAESTKITLQGSAGNAIAEIPTGISPALAKAAGVTRPERDIRLTGFDLLMYEPGKFATVHGAPALVEIDDRTGGKRTSLSAIKIAGAFSDIDGSVEAFSAEGKAALSTTTITAGKENSTVTAVAETVIYSAVTQRAEMHGGCLLTILDAAHLEGPGSLKATDAEANFGEPFISLKASAQGVAVANSRAFLPFKRAISPLKGQVAAAKFDVTDLEIAHFSTIEYHAEQGGFAAGEDIQFTSIGHLKGTSAHLNCHRVDFVLAGQPAQLTTADITGPAHFHMEWSSTEAGKPVSNAMSGTCGSMHLNGDMTWLELRNKVAATLNARGGAGDTQVEVLCDRMAASGGESSTVDISGAAEANSLTLTRYVTPTVTNHLSAVHFEQAVLGGTQGFKATGPALICSVAQNSAERTAEIAAATIEGYAVGTNGKDWMVHAASGVRFNLAEPDSSTGVKSMVRAVGTASDLLFGSTQDQNVELSGPIHLVITDSARLAEPGTLDAPDDQKLKATLSRGVEGFEFTAGRSPVQLTLLPIRKQKPTKAKETDLNTAGGKK